MAESANNFLDWRDIDTWGLLISEPETPSNNSIKAGLCSEKPASNHLAHCHSLHIPLHRDLQTYM
jgi:hypothetical protein